MVFMILVKSERCIHNIKFKIRKILLNIEILMSYTKMTTKVFVQNVKSDINNIILGFQYTRIQTATPWTINRHLNSRETKKLRF